MSFTSKNNIFTFKTNKEDLFIVEDYCSGEKSICHLSTILKQSNQQLLNLVEDGRKTKHGGEILGSLSESTIIKRRLSLEIRSGR